MCNLPVCCGSGRAVELCSMILPPRLANMPQTHGICHMPRDKSKIAEEDWDLDLAPPTRMGRAWPGHTPSPRCRTCGLGCWMRAVDGAIRVLGSVTGGWDGSSMNLVASLAPLAGSFLAGTCMHFCLPLPPEIPVGSFKRPALVQCSRAASYFCAWLLVALAFEL